MSETETRTGSFFDAEESELVRYRAVSKLALAALLVGLFSPLALSHLLLCAVPLTAIALSLAALRAISKPDSRLIGRRAANFAFILGAFFLMLTLSSYFSRRHMICRQAEEYAVYWLDLVRSAKVEDADTAEDIRQKHWKLYEAYELTKEFNNRVPRGVDLEQLYGDPNVEFNPFQQSGEEASQLDQARMAFLRKFSDEPLETILNVSQAGNLQYHGVHLYTTRKGTQVVSLSYSLTYGDGGQTKTLPFLVHVSRSDLDDADEQAQKQWRIESVSHGP